MKLLLAALLIGVVAVAIVSIPDAKRYKEITDM